VRKSAGQHIGPIRITPKRSSCTRQPDVAALSICGPPQRPRCPHADRPPGSTARVSRSRASVSRHHSAPRDKCERMDAARPRLRERQKTYLKTAARSRFLAKGGDRNSGLAHRVYMIEDVEKLPQPRTSGRPIAQTITPAGSPRPTSPACVLGRGGGAPRRRLP